MSSVYQLSGISIHSGSKNSQSKGTRCTVWKMCIYWNKCFCYVLFETTPHLNCPCQITLWSNYQGLTLPPLLTPTVDTTYSDVVLIACHETSQFILCNGGIRDVHRSIMWELGSTGAGNVDEVEISTVSTTQCPAHSHFHSSTDISIEVFISREVNTREGGDRGGT